MGRIHKKLMYHAVRAEGGDGNQEREKTEGGQNSEIRIQETEGNRRGRRGRPSANSG
jgi:hypothetical protein